MLSDDQIRAAYSKAGAQNTMTEANIQQAKLFIGFIFDTLEQAAYDDNDFQPMYKRPEFQ